MTQHRPLRTPELSTPNTVTLSSQTSVLREEKDRGQRERRRAVRRDECRSLGWLRLSCAGLRCERKARSGWLAKRRKKKDMTDWLVQSMGEILLNCSVGTGRSHEMHMKVGLSRSLSLRPAEGTEDLISHIRPSYIRM